MLDKHQEVRRMPGSSMMNNGRWRGWTKRPRVHNQSSAFSHSEKPSPPLTLIINYISVLFHQLYVPLYVHHSTRGADSDWNYYITTKVCCQPITTPVLQVSSWRLLVPPGCHPEDCWHPCEESVILTSADHPWVLISNFGNCRCHFGCATTVLSWSSVPAM